MKIYIKPKLKKSSSILITGDAAEKYCSACC